MLWAYDNTPGVAANSPTDWPADSRLTRAADRPTLVVLVHPQCSCSRASLGELAELLARTTQRPQTYVVFMKPFGVPQDWEKTTLWRTAAGLPDVTVLRDDNGMEATRFGAITSGQTVLYDTAGALLFSGGITGSRGHGGNNAGRASLLALLNQEKPAQSWTSVFGCPLFTFSS